MVGEACPSYDRGVSSDVPLAMVASLVVKFAKVEIVGVQVVKAVRVGKTEAEGLQRKEEALVVKAAKVVVKAAVVKVEKEGQIEKIEAEGQPQKEEAEECRTATE